MNKSEQINELATALSLAQAEITSAVREKENSFYKGKDGNPSLYADLEAVVEAAKGPLSKNGLSVTQLIDDKFLETVLMHKSGQWVSSRCPLVTRDQSPHSLGSAITYFRRFSYASIVGVTQTDDDGNAAQGVLVKPKKEFNAPAVRSEPINHAPTKVGGISDAQRKRLFVLKREARWTDDQVAQFMKDKFSIDSSKDLNQEQYKLITDILVKKQPYDSAINQ